MTLRESVIQRVGELGGRLRVRSALNPILWLCAIVTLPGMFLISGMGQPLQWLVFLVCAPVVCAMIGFLFLLRYDRDKLQSEDFQIRKQTLELIQEKGDKFPILGTSIHAITNPDQPSVADDKSEDDK